LENIIYTSGYDAVEQALLRPTVSFPSFHSWLWSKSAVFTMRTQMVLPAWLAPCILASGLPTKLEIRRAVDSSLANIHISYSSPPTDCQIAFTYGSCDSRRPGDAHHVVSRVGDCNHDRLLWKIPELAPSGQCLSAWDSRQNLIGRSSAVDITPNRKTMQRRLRKRQADVSIAMDNSSHIDAEGPWFDGVVALQNKEISALDSQEAKAKEIAVVGAGMAGLMTWICLDEAGMTNISLIEAAQRLGGRVHTAYFGDPEDRQYQDRYAALIAIYPLTNSTDGADEISPLSHVQRHERDFANPRSSHRV